MLCLFLIDSACVVGRVISPSVTHDTATLHKYTNSTSSHTSRAVSYHGGMITVVFNQCSITMATTFLLLTSNWFIALAAVSTVENSRVIVSRVLSLSR